MKKFLLYLLLLNLSSLLNAVIIETDDFTILTTYADKDTLVIFDIDNTIARTETELGSDEWFSHLVNQKIAQGHDIFSAIYLVLPLAYYAQFNLPLQLTDPILYDIFAFLRTNNISTVALTSRGLYLAERTHEQLKNINLIFYTYITHASEFLIPLPHPCLFKYNIIFCSNNNKGEALLAFLHIINYHPQKIIFIDDKMSHVKAVESALLSFDIEYIGIRYTGCDHHIHNFDPAKAQAQLDNLKEENNLTNQALELFLHNS